jgi:hypothetical protein
MKPTGRRSFGRVALGLTWFALIVPCTSAAELRPEEVRQLSRFAGTAGLRDVPDEARAGRRAEVQRSYQEARSLLGGRGADVARYFLTHPAVPPTNDAYFFAFEALADTDTALILIHSLGAPLKDGSRAFLPAENRAWLRERDDFEICVAIESVLADNVVRRDPRTVSVLQEAVARLRAKPYGVDPRHAGMVVGLLGRCAGPEAAAALRGLAVDPEPSIRSLAVEALGRTAATAKTEKADQTATFPTLVHVLRADVRESARLAAAAALGRLGAEAVPVLQEALASERHPQVVDGCVRPPAIERAAG